ncbi:hypothetical protein B296_00019871 [Ensete ventricosum]|uniref:DUF834 domain-containing protein n=1 Tax=Ensete ventricosum TaxID=4639 RepID=A0A426YT34_ENSVE|nr:hypothetical protein B296_00019871 [Ensete ventricosum]
MMAGNAGQGWKMAATSVAAIVKWGNNGVSGEGAGDDTDRGREHWRRRREEGSEDIIDGEQRHQGLLMRRQRQGRGDEEVEAMTTTEEEVASIDGSSSNVRGGHWKEDDDSGRGFGDSWLWATEGWATVVKPLG